MNLHTIQYQLYVESKKNVTNELIYKMETALSPRGRACAARGRNLWDIRTGLSHAESGRPPQARAVLQQCLHAQLQVRPAEGDAAAQWVEVQRGLVIYV